MVISEVTGKYEELRGTYNSVVDEDCVYSVKVPPMEEWRDMTCVCDHLFCRWVGVPSLRGVGRCRRAPVGRDLTLLVAVL